MLKICYVCGDPGIRLSGTKGASAHVRELMRALHALGHDISAVIACSGTDHAVPARVYEVPVSDLSLMMSEALGVGRKLRGLFHNLTLEASLSSILAKEEPGVILERYSLFSVACGRVAHKYGLPFILEVNAPLAWEATQFRGLTHSKLAEMFEREAWMQADRIVTVSENLQEIIVEQGVPAEKVTVIPNGVDPQRFHPQVNGNPLRAQLGLLEKFVIGFAGSLKPWHGLDRLRSAFSQLVKDQRFHLLIVGDGPGRLLVEQLAAELPGRVTHVGAVAHDAVPAYLSAMDVFVAPYAPLPRFYFSPLKVIEAMACGKPVIASGLGQLTQIIDQGRTGLLVRPDDTDALAAAILDLADDPGKGLRLGHEAAQRALTHYSWDRVAREIMRLISSIRPSAGGS